jgi:hypothetical protein
MCKRLSAVIVILLTANALLADSYKQITALRDRAKAAIDAGNVDVDRDLAPLIDMLRRSKDDEDQRHLVDAIIDLGRADGNSPAAVKHYVIEQMTPLLTSIAENPKNSNFLRGDALLGLRNMGASKAALQHVAEMALEDSDSYVQSRGEILQNYIKSMPDDGREAIRPTDAAREQQAIEFLKSRGLGVSVEQLKRSAMEAKADEVRALINAGVDVNIGDANGTALYSAMLGCANGGGENDAIVKTVEALLNGDADVKRTDDNGNTPLISAAQYCGPRVIRALIDHGAEVNVINGSGTTPLMIAFFMNHLDAAEALVAKGAKLTTQQAQVVSASATDPRAKAIIAKATAAKKKK